MQADFHGSTVLVTGGTRGIGRALVEAFADAGADVAFTFRSSTDAAAALVESLEEQGTEALSLQGDVADLETAQSHVDAVTEQFGGLDVLVNNAGIYPENDALDATIDQLDRAWTVNTRGPWLLVQAFVPDMIERGYGRVVNVSSGSGSFGEGLDPDHAPYAASKSALNALTMTLDAPLPEDADVKVNAMCPGWVHTRMGGKEAPRTPEEGADTALWLATLPADGPSGGFFRDRERIPW